MEYCSRAQALRDMGSCALKCFVIGLVGNPILQSGSLVRLVSLPASHMGCGVSDVDQNNH